MRKIEYDRTYGGNPTFYYGKGFNPSGSRKSRSSTQAYIKYGGSLRKSQKRPSGAPYTYAKKRAERGMNTDEDRAPWPGYYDVEPSVWKKQGYGQYLQDREVFGAGSLEVPRPELGDRRVMYYEDASPYQRQMSQFHGRYAGWPGSQGREQYRSRGYPVWNREPADDWEREQEFYDMAESERKFRQGGFKFVPEEALEDYYTPEKEGYEILKREREESIAVGDLPVLPSNGEVLKKVKFED